MKKRKALFRGGGRLARRGRAGTGDLGGGEADGTPFKAAWIYVGPHNDGGWSQAHDKGRLYVQKAARLEGTDDLQGELAGGPQFTQVIDQVSSAGGTTRSSSRPRSATRPCAGRGEVSRRSSSSRRPGRASPRTSREYYGAGEDAIYLSGMAAGAATKTRHVGYVVPFAIPEVIRHTNAFTLGVQTTHPGAKVKIDLDELLVRSGQGEEGGPEPEAGRCRRDRAERRRPGDRPVRRVGRRSRGSATTPTRRSSRRSRG